MDIQIAFSASLYPSPLPAKLFSYTSGMTTKQRIVIKLGSSVLSAGTTRLHRPTMVDLVRQISTLHAAGHEIIMCSSGAIVAGRERLGDAEKPKTITDKQMLASVGQSYLMFTWEQLFDIYGILVGQILLTRSDFEVRNRYLNARDTIQALVTKRIIPIINENDAVTTEEIRVGDNDNLSARTAIMAQADLLILLTDQPGLYTADPRNDPKATLIDEVSEITDAVKAIAGGSGTQIGTGGMGTKLEAANIAQRGGTSVVIAKGAEPDILTNLVQHNQAIGTRIPAKDNPAKNRRRWLLTGVDSAGSIEINANAEKALRQKKGASLLPAGIVQVHGDFLRGEPVSICNETGDEIGRGIARYTSIDLNRIAGHRSDEIPGILGYAYGPVAIHRNDLVLLKN